MKISPEYQRALDGHAPQCWPSLAGMPRLHNLPRRRSPQSRWPCAAAAVPPAGRLRSIVLGLKSELPAFGTLQLSIGGGSIGQAGCRRDQCGSGQLEAPTRPLPAEWRPSRPAGAAWRLRALSTEERQSAMAPRPSLSQPVEPGKDLQRQGQCEGIPHFLRHRHRHGSCSCHQFWGLDIGCPGLHRWFPPPPCSRGRAAPCGHGGQNAQHAAGPFCGHMEYLSEHPPGQGKAPGASLATPDRRGCPLPSYASTFNNAFEKLMGSVHPVQPVLCVCRETGALQDCSAWGKSSLTASSRQ